jgi:hypothetical protein
MDSSVSAKNEIWFVRVFHHVSNAVYSATVRVTAAVLLSGGRCGSLAGCVERIGAAILFGDVSNDETECDDNYVGRTVARSVRKT